MSYYCFRCVKPNHHLSAGKFDSELIRRQLLCNGLMELAELRRDGYPVRIRFEDFVDRYVLSCLTILMFIDLVSTY